MPERKLRMCHLEGKKNLVKPFFPLLRATKRKDFSVAWFLSALACLATLFSPKIGDLLLSASNLAHNLWPCFLPLSLFPLFSVPPTGAGSIFTLINPKKQAAGAWKGRRRKQRANFCCFFCTREKKSHKEFRSYPGKQAQREQYEKGSNKRCFLGKNLTKRLKLQ